MASEFYSASPQLDSSLSTATDAVVTDAAAVDILAADVVATDILATDGAPDEPRSHRVLVVENDIETANLVIALLENAGYTVEVATDGQYALLLADTFEPELILLGLSLPGMNGYEVTHILRTEPRYAQRFRPTRIFYISGKDQMLQKRFHSLPDTPMSDYIFKPVDTAELLDKVARVFADRPFGEKPHLNDL